MTAITSLFRPAALALFLGLGTAGAAGAACYADYKAKQDAPLRLAYGVAELPAAGCSSKAEARAVLKPRLQAAGWQLLNVLSIFGPEGLDERKASAGEFFLRY